MSLQCVVFRGLVKEAEEDVNKFLVTNHGVRVIHMAQSESPDGHISITMLVELADYLSEEGL
ncbi:MAG: hypothetical protein HRU01_05530 [Myxococcales bacterium]|nr:hypothetical protein [Myxococcales bacterium]